MPEIAYCNGRILPIEEAMVPVEDRGYQFGEAVYEVIASYGGQLFCLEEHLQRLQRSMGQLDFPPVSMEKVRQTAVDIFDRAQLPRAALYIQVSRGVAPRNHAYPAHTETQLIMTVRSVSEIPQQARADGLAVITVRDFRWGRCDLKTVQLLANARAKQQAAESRVPWRHVRIEHFWRLPNRTDGRMPN